MNTPVPTVFNWQSTETKNWLEKKWSLVLLNLLMYEYRLFFHLFSFFTFSQYFFCFPVHLSLDVFQRV